MADASDDPLFHFSFSPAWRRGSSSPPSRLERSLSLICFGCIEAGRWQALFFSFLTLFSQCLMSITQEASITIQRIWSEKAHTESPRDGRLRSSWRGLLEISSSRVFGLVSEADTRRKTFSLLRLRRNCGCRQRTETKCPTRVCLYTSLILFPQMSGATYALWSRINTLVADNLRCILLRTVRRIPLRP